MKKIAVDVLKQGLKSRDRLTREVSRNALQILGEEVPGKPTPRRPAARGLRIREIVNKDRPRRQVDVRRTRG
jgi:hypothetical protein